MRWQYFYVFKSKEKVSPSFKKKSRSHAFVLRVKFESPANCRNHLQLNKPDSLTDKQYFALLFQDYCDIILSSRRYCLTLKAVHSES